MKRQDARYLDNSRDITFNLKSFVAASESEPAVDCDEQRDNPSGVSFHLFALLNLPIFRKAVLDAYNQKRADQIGFEV